MARSSLSGFRVLPELNQPQPLKLGGKIRILDKASRLERKSKKKKKKQSVFSSVGFRVIKTKIRGEGDPDAAGTETKPR